MLVISLAGCSSDGLSDLQTFVFEEKQRKAKRIEPLPEFEVYETFTYAARELRDPFKLEEEAVLSEAESTPSSGLRPDGNRNREALEAFPLDALEFIGLMQKDETVWGIVKAPDGLVHRIQVGNYMGQNNGKIIAIDESKVELKEIVSDGRTGWFEREAALAIAE